MYLTTQTTWAFAKALVITMLGLALSFGQATAQSTIGGPVGINTTTPITDLDVRGSNIFLAPNPKEPFPPQFASMGESGGACAGWGFRTQTSTTRYMTMFMQGGNLEGSIPTISFSDPYLDFRKDLGNGCGNLIARFNDGLIRFYEDFQFGSVEILRDGGGNTAELVDASFISDDNLTWDLGRTDRRWDEVFCVSLDASSDRRMKNSIEDLPYGLEEIMQLRPVSYNWNHAPEKGRSLGLIAQEVQGVINEVVSDPSKRLQPNEDGEMVPENPNGMLGLYYIEIIPVLIKGIQEQQAQIEELKAQLKDQKSSLDVPSTGSTKGSGLDGVMLYQNAPNPFSDITRIEYQLPSDVKTAEIFLFDMQGKQVRRLDANPKAGRNSIEIQAASLEAGMYLYSLVINGLESDTKRMIISK
ncbi:MAG: tail fiber domain-containing protein [Bacteroidia bacterium]|nr:tail fiber domain-containing protein [Bacteroidia bacterium]